MNYNSINTPFMPDGKGSIALVLLQKKELEIIQILERCKENIEHRSYWYDKLMITRKEMLNIKESECQIEQ